MPVRWINAGQPCSGLIVEHRSARLVGTTTAQVIAQTRVPVLVIRDPAPLLAFARKERPLRLLLGIDDSATSEVLGGGFIAEAVPQSLVA